MQGIIIESQRINFELQLDMFLWNTDAPAATKLKSGKMSKSQILTPTPPQGHVISLKCEKALDELTVQV